MIDYGENFIFERLQSWFLKRICKNFALLFGWKCHCFWDRLLNALLHPPGEPWALTSLLRTTVKGRRQGLAYSGTGKEAQQCPVFLGEPIGTASFSSDLMKESLLLLIIGIVLWLILGHFIHWFVFLSWFHYNVSSRIAVRAKIFVFFFVFCCMTST